MAIVYQTIATGTLGGVYGATGDTYYITIDASDYGNQLTVGSSVLPLGTVYFIIDGVTDIDLDQRLLSLSGSAFMMDGVAGCYGVRFHNGPKTLPLGSLYLQTSLAMHWNRCVFEDMGYIYCHSSGQKWTNNLFISVNNTANAPVDQGALMNCAFSGAATTGYFVNNTVIPQLADQGIDLDAKVIHKGATINDHFEAWNNAIYEYTDPWDEDVFVNASSYHDYNVTTGNDEDNGVNAGPDIDGDDYIPTLGGNCYHAGQVDAAVHGSTDLSGYPRYPGGSITVGCYASHRVQNPTTSAGTQMALSQSEMATTSLRSSDNSPRGRSTV